MRLRTEKPTAVSDLLEQGTGMLEKLRSGSIEADRALAALRRVLPPELAGAVWSASLSQATLTAFVPTAAWGTRLRYVAPKVLPEIAREMGAPVAEIKVKVRPRRGRSPSAKGP